MPMTAKVSRYVYVIASDVGVTKVGIAESAARRFSQLQTDSPVPLRLFDSFQLPRRLAKEVEALCHNELADFHSHRGWFKINPETAWECVKKHGNAVMKAKDIDHVEQRRRDDWLLNQIESMA